MTPALRIKDLKKVYAGGMEALKGIDLTITEGDFFALLGPNGAGKTTAIGIVAGLVNKTSGTVEVFGKNIDTDPEKAKAEIGIVPQEMNFNIFEKVEDIIVTQGGYYGLPRPLARERAEKYLKQLGLWEKRKEQSRALSGGMKRVTKFRSPASTAPFCNSRYRGRCSLFHSTLQRHCKSFIDEAKSC